MTTHGALDTYVNHGCRYLPRTSTSAEYSRHQARLRAYGLLEHRVGAVRNSIEIALRRVGRTDLIGRITSNRWVAA